MSTIKSTFPIIALGVILATLLGGCAGYSITKYGTGVGYDAYKPDLICWLTAKAQKSSGFQTLRKITKLPRGTF